MPCPLAPTPPDSPAPKRFGRPVQPLQGLTILTVEDSRFASESLRLLCLRSDARLRRAESLEQADRHLSVYRPDIVIVDLGLPDGDGTDLIRRLARQRCPGPVVLGTSGDPAGQKAALAAGAAGFLPKPIDSLAHFQATVLGHLQAAPPTSCARLMMPAAGTMWRPFWAVWPARPRTAIWNRPRPMPPLRHWRCRSWQRWLPRAWPPTPRPSGRPTAPFLFPVRQGKDGGFTAQPAPRPGDPR